MVEGKSRQILNCSIICLTYSWNTRKPNRDGESIYCGGVLCALCRCRLGIDNLDALELEEVGFFET